MIQLRNPSAYKQILADLDNATPVIAEQSKQRSALAIAIIKTRDALKLAEDGPVARSPEERAARASALLEGAAVGEDQSFVSQAERIAAIKGDLQSLVVTQQRCSAILAAASTKSAAAKKALVSALHADFAVYFEIELAKLLETYMAPMVALQHHLEAECTVRMRANWSAAPGTPTAEILCRARPGSPVPFFSVSKTFADGFYQSACDQIRAADDEAKAA